MRFRFTVYLKIWSILILHQACVPSIPAGQEEPDPSLLTLDRIFDSGEFSTKQFGPARWLPDGSGYLTLESSRDPAGGKDIVRYDPESGDREVLVSAGLLVPSSRSSSPLDIDGYELSRDGSLLLVYTNSKRVWRRNTRGDYWVLDISGRELRKLGGDAGPSTLMFAKLSPDGRAVAYVRENNLYVEDLRSREITRITGDGSSTVINGTADWVYEEELDLRDGYRWSPDGRWIAYWQLNSRGVRKFHLINNTDSLYPRIQSIRYPLAGEKNSSCRVGVVSARGGETRWLQVPGDPRNHYIARMDWAGPGEVILQQLNRHQNTLKVILGDIRTGKVRTVLTEKDEAWVDVEDGLHWLDEGSCFTWMSERDGWRHVYLVSRSGEEMKLITAGKYDVIRIAGIDEKGGWLYFIASPRNPTQRYLYRIPLGGGKARRVTPDGQPGTHGYQISPDARWAIQTHSSFDVPPVIRLVSLPGHEEVRMLEDNSELREKLEKLKRSPTEFFRMEIEDGVFLDAWCQRPPDFHPEKKYPLLFYVYGEPAGQTVLDRWRGSGYLWHLLLTQKGYLVMSVDNRGTPAPRGRRWRKIVYRQIGILASADQAAAARKILETRPYVDPGRIGIWGWSGGGSMSLNAIFRYPDLYRTAMAIAFISNERYYDTIYQERYMGLPRENVEGFKKGSPITYAHQLKGDLLLVYGTGDDNCHYQNCEALVNELIRHNKQFSLMVYPNRSHGIYEGVNTRRHLYQLLTSYLLEHLPPGPAL